MKLGLTGGLTAALVMVGSAGAIAQEVVTLQTTTRTGETLYLSSRSAHDYTLRLTSATRLNGLDLPAETIVRGQFEPVDGGLQYVANSVEVGNRIYDLSAVSELLRDRKDPRETSAGAILGDAAIGAAGGYVLGEVLGDAGALEVLGGAAAGVLIGNATAPFVVVIEPDEVISLSAEQTTSSNYLVR